MSSSFSVHRPQDGDLNHNDGANSAAPSGAKAQIFVWGMIGTAEAMPYPTQYC
jgi:hypothetical protein